MGLLQITTAVVSSRAFMGWGDGSGGKGTSHISLTLEFTSWKPTQKGRCGGTHNSGSPMARWETGTEDSRTEDSGTEDPETQEQQQQQERQRRSKRRRRNN